MHGVLVSETLKLKNCKRRSKLLAYIKPSAFYPSPFHQRLVIMREQMRLYLADGIQSYADDNQ